MDTVFGNSGPCILEEYSLKFEEQKTQIEILTQELSAFRNDNQQLIEQAAHDTANLEGKETEIQKLKRQLATIQRESNKVG